MSLDEMPINDKSDKAVEPPEKDASRQMMLELMEGGKIQIAANQATPNEVTNIGQIARLTLPTGFEPGVKRAGTSGNNFFAEYHLASDPDVLLYFEYRGARMSKASSDSFRQLLEGPAHHIKADQLQEFGELLSDKRNPKDFRVDVARTQDLNGKRVLVVEGRYLKHDLQARTIYIDADGSGSAVQEVTFQTPPDKVNQHFLSGVQALESIKWK
ncbi:MAG: hypothetical protein K8F91_10460 [Candidatus Obscuribacterales bacterium]|nr:hypothetical protein [Candidatus Obscuribacterales bacterium]